MMTIERNPSALKALSLGLLVCIAVFSTTYSVGGVFIYPRLFIAFLGFLLVLRSRKLFRLISPIIATTPIFLFTLAFAGMHDEWRHLPVVVNLIIRGIVIPYFTAILLVQLISRAVLESKTDKRWRFLIMIILAAIAVQAALAFFQLINSGFRENFINFVNLEEGWREMAALGLPRFTGVGGISIYDTALSYCLFGAIFLVNKRYRTDGPWMNSALIAVLILLSVLHGRTGLLFMLALVSLIALQEICVLRGKSFVIFRVFALIFGGAFLLYTFIAPENIDYILDTSGELFVNFIAGEGFRTDSTDDLLENYLVLPSSQAILLGSGVWAQPDLATQLGFNYSTDSGYLLLLNYGGVSFLLVFLITLFFIIYYYCIANSVVQSQIFSFNRLLFVFYVFSILFISCIKGPLFLSEHFMTSLFLMLGVVYRLGKSSK